MRNMLSAVKAMNVSVLAMNRPTFTFCLGFCEFQQLTVAMYVFHILIMRSFAYLLLNKISA
jgi:hypothetical protein